MCFGCSKESSHRDGSFECPQRMFWLRNQENKFSVTHSYLGGGGGCWCDSNPHLLGTPPTELQNSLQKAAIILQLAIKVDILLLWVSDKI